MGEFVTVSGHRDLSAGGADKHRVQADGENL